MEGEGKLKTLPVWKGLNKFLKGCSEDEATGLLELEQSMPSPRVAIVKQIQQRINVLRSRRELSEQIERAMKKEE